MKNVSTRLLTLLDYDIETVTLKMNVTLTTLKSIALKQTFVQMNVSIFIQTIMCVR